MTEYDLIKMEKKLSKYLDKNRFLHTRGVMYTCASLAMKYGYDLKVAQVAGLLHDSAKCIPNKKKLSMCKKYHIAYSTFEQERPFLLHAKLGAYLAKEKYGVEDEEILSAITFHTTGRAQMSLLEKIVYIADYIEPMRCKAPNLTEIRKLAFEDLDECVYEILGATLIYLGDDPQNIDDTSKIAFEFYEKLHIERKAGKEQEL